MGKTRREPSREESFHKHYAAIWGEERWQNSLCPALTRSTRHSALINQALSAEVVTMVIRAGGIPTEGLEPISLPGEADGNGGNEKYCLARRINPNTDDGAEDGPSFAPPQPLKYAAGNVALMSHWNMDAASVLAASVLNTCGGETVLDLCAAPGGKSIALAQNLFFSSNRHTSTDPASSQKHTRTLLCSNEADKARYRRLMENLRAYLPENLNVKCTNIDASSPNAHRELSIAGGWDKVLVDAPCSSERHIIHAHIKAQASARIAPEMANWRPGSTKRRQETQLKLLMTALRLVKDHGKVLYATCSIEPGENDGVIEKATAQVEKELKKGLITWSVKLDCFSLPLTEEGADTFLEKQWAERTKHGWIALPDHPGGGRWGPLFFAMLIKVPAGG